VIGVLMASSAPGRRRPDVRESLDLVMSGLRTWWGVGAGGLSAASRSAATMFGFLVSSILLAAWSWSQVSTGIARRGPGV
jgi:hypothetical protein